MPYHLQVPLVWLSAASLTKQQNSSEVRAGIHLTAHRDRSQHHGSYFLRVPSPSSFYTAKIQTAKSNLFLLVLPFGKFISKIPFILRL